MDDGASLSPQGDKETGPPSRRPPKRGLGQCSICLGDNKGFVAFLYYPAHIMHNSCLESFKPFEGHEGR